MNRVVRVCLVVALILGLPVPTTADEGAASIIVFGGTGRLGSDIVKALVADGHDVTVFARPSSNRDRLADLAVDFVTGDVLDAASVDRALSVRQYDVVIDALGRGSAPVDFYRTSAENIAASAARFGVRQIILHGSVGARDSATAYGGQGLSPGMQRLMAAKSAGESAVARSGVAYTIIRNSRLLSYGTRESGHAVLYEDQTLTGPVTREGLARLTAGCVLAERCFDKVFHAIDMTRIRSGRSDTD